MRILDIVLVKFEDILRWKICSESEIRQSIVVSKVLLHGGGNTKLSR